MDREIAEAYALCRRVAHRYGPNFSVGFRFLPQSKRDAVYASYAFCRYVDDVVDENPEQATADIRKSLDQWEEELERCYAGSPTRPISVALADAASRYAIPKESFAGLIEGCRMDLVKNRYADFDELMVYSDLVATTISSMSLAIFGYRDEQALDRGRDLATAFQLTNILRDVGEDTHKDRIYLPQDELARFGVTEVDLKQKKMTPGFTEMMRFQVERVRELYNRAEPLLDLHRARRAPLHLSHGLGVLPDSEQDRGARLPDLRWPGRAFAWRQARSRGTCLPHAEAELEGLRECVCSRGKLNIVN